MEFQINELPYLLFNIQFLAKFSGSNSLDRTSQDFSKRFDYYFPQNLDKTCSLH